MSVAYRSALCSGPYMACHSLLTQAERIICSECSSRTIRDIGMAYHMDIGTRVS